MYSLFTNLFFENTKWKLTQLFFMATLGRMRLRMGGKFGTIITEIITFRAKILVPNCILLADGLIQDLNVLFVLLGFSVNFVEIGQMKVELKNVFKGSIASVAFLFFEDFVIVGHMGFKQ